ncbi:MAG: peptide/nickel transport system permease protein [Thermotogaceae bacterium]|nr:peptide/nickel transport system permease protein [Thermotogaceae bacterium]
MTAYIIRRLLILPIILIGITLIIFSMIWMLGPDRLLASYIKSPEALKTEDAKERLIAKYGLDEPTVVQYFKWLGNILQGDFGYSNIAKKPVQEAIAERIPYTLELALWAIIPVIAGGIWLGIVSGTHHNQPLDHGIRIVSLIGWSMPDFVFGLLILLLFYTVLGWFPPGYLSYESEAILRSAEWTKYTHMATIDSILNWNFSVFIDAFRHLIGPILTISYLWWAYVLRITRSSMLEVLKKDYIRTARAKGLSENVVINKHARKNALIPVVTVAGGMLVSLLAGVVIVESVFNRPGLGRFTAQAATQLDYFSILGSALVFSIILVLVNLIVDISYAFIDPRIRLS